jgi:uncharacterized membrane protein YgcG
MIYQSWDPVVCHSHNLAACTKVVVVFKEVVPKEVAIKELESLGEDLTACLRLVDRSRELTMVRESEIQCFLATLEKEQEYNPGGRGRGGSGRSGMGGMGEGGGMFGGPGQ